MPPTPAFFSMIVKGMPACLSLMPASTPDSPAPITNTGRAARASAGEVVATARGSPPSSSISSSTIGTYSSGTGSHTSHAIISLMSSSDGGGGSTPSPSRKAMIASRARARISAFWSSGR